MTDTVHSSPLKTNQFLKLPTFLRQYELNPTEKIVYSTLCGFNGPSGCFPSLQTVANSVGRSSAVVSRAVKKLAELGLVYKRKAAAGNGHLRNTYIIPHMKDQVTKSIDDGVSFHFSKIPIGGVFSSLKPREKIVLGELLRCNGRRGCFPKLESISKKINISKSSVSDSILTLEHLQIIFVKRTGRANEYTFNKKYFSVLRQADSESVIPEDSLQKCKLPRSDLDSHVQHSAVSDREPQELKGEEPAVEVVEEDVETSKKVFSEFQKAMECRGMHVPYGLKDFEIPQVVGMVREIGIKNSLDLMTYAVREWEVLASTTGSDGKKLLPNPNFNQIVAYWRPRIWSARMTGKKSDRPSKQKQVADRAVVEKKEAIKGYISNWKNFF